MEKILKYKLKLIGVVILIILVSVLIYLSFSKKSTIINVNLEPGDLVVVASSSIGKEETDAQVFYFSTEGKLKAESVIKNISGLVVSKNYSDPLNIYSKFSSKYLNITKGIEIVEDFENDGIAANTVSNNKWEVTYYNIGGDDNGYSTEYRVNSLISDRKYNISKNGTYGATYGIFENELYVLYSQAGVLLPLYIEVFDLEKNISKKTVKLEDDIATYFNSVDPSTLYFYNDKVLLASGHSGYSFVGVFDKELNLIKKVEFKTDLNKRFPSIESMAVINELLYIYTFDNILHIFDKDLNLTREVILDKSVELSLNSPLGDEVLFFGGKLNMLKEYSNKFERYIFNVDTGRSENLIEYKLPKINNKSYNLEGVIII